jgi:DNA invertase Pin-like site-specific DNA recombinase
MLLDFLRAGDTLVVTRIDYLARSLREGSRTRRMR